MFQTPLVPSHPIECVPAGHMLVRKFLFTVPGLPLGYYAEGRTPNWTRKRRYEEYKGVVKKVALMAGLQTPILGVDERNPVWVHCEPYYLNRKHCDPGNVQKGVCDALFWGMRGGGGDKYTGGSFTPPRYDASPRVDVTVLFFQAV